MWKPTYTFDQNWNITHIKQEITMTMEELLDYHRPKIDPLDLDLIESKFWEFDGYIKKKKILKLLKDHNLLK